MLPKLKEAKYQGDYRIWLRFADGVKGMINLETKSLDKKSIVPYTLYVAFAGSIDRAVAE